MSEYLVMRTALRECTPYIGDEVHAHHTEAGIYGAALRSLGHDTAMMPVQDIPTIFRNMLRAGTLRTRGPTKRADSIQQRMSDSFRRL